MTTVASSERPQFSLRRICALAFLACSAALCLGTRAEADGLSAFVDLGYASSDVTVKDPTGVSTKSTSNSFAQRYNVSLGKQIYPSLALSAGGIFINIESHSDTAGTSSSSSDTSLSPFASLALTNSFLPTSFGYSRREETTVSNGVSAPARILETYSARTSLKPEGLPPLDFGYSRTHAFDQDRTLQDLTTESYMWGTNYLPTSKITLGYQGGFTTSANAISHLDTEGLTNTARAGYADLFFDNRVNFSANYNLSTSSSRVTSSGQGFVYLPQTPLGGTLSATTPTSTAPIITVDNGQLTSNPALNAGSANINLVTPTQPIPTTTMLNMGFDFGFGSKVSVNTIYLTVVSGTNPRPAALEQISNINQIFTWKIYTSDDGVTWTPSTVTVDQSFGSDPSGLSDTVGFILTFGSPLASRFVKAVIPPVLVENLRTPQIYPIFLNGSNQLDINSVAVTRLQAFDKQDAKTFAGGGVDSISGQLGMSATAQILRDNPSLTYDVGFGLAHNSGTNQDLSISWFLSNGLSLDHKFNQVFSGTARVSLQQQQGSQGPLTSNLAYSAGLGIVPLPTLTHAISFSGTISNLGDPNSTTSNAFFISNNAQLYKGVTLSLSGGYSTSTAASGQVSDSVVFNAGLSLVPRRDLSLTVGYSDSSAKQSGGGLPTQETFSRSASVGATYSVTEALYLAGSWSINIQNDQPTFTTQNYAVSWAPLRGGALQCTFSYAESQSSLDNSKTRTISPTVRWNIRPGLTLDLAYQYLTLSSPAAGTTEARSLSSTLRLTL